MHLSKWVRRGREGGGGHPEADLRNSDGDTVCHSESSPCHELLLSETPSKRSTFLPFVMSECCQSDIRKNCCCQSPLYGQIYPCHNPVGGLGIHFDRCITTDCYRSRIYPFYLFYCTLWYWQISYTLSYAGLQILETLPISTFWYLIYRER